MPLITNTYSTGYVNTDLWRRIYNFERSIAKEGDITVMEFNLKVVDKRGILSDDYIRTLAFRRGTLDGKIDPPETEERKARRWRIVR